MLMRIILISVVLAGFCITGSLTPAAAAAAPAQSQQEGQNYLHRLEGRWVRPDGGYILELREIKEDGSLKAAYFNPRPINVQRSSWTRKDGKLTVFVELRDINYPGSKYELRYDPASDKLKGSYFQAVEQQTYTIEFVRPK